jgi:hypothetical protein
MGELSVIYVYEDETWKVLKAVCRLLPGTSVTKVQPQPPAEQPA